MYAVIPGIMIFSKSSIQVNPRCYKCEVTSYYLKEMNILIQINIYSIREEMSPQIRERAKMLLRNHFVDFTGSDAHRMDHRAPSVSTGSKYLYEKFDRDYVDLILSGNARERILNVPS